MFKRFFLYRYCFKEEVEIDEEIKDYLTVKKTFCGEKNFYVYTESEMELTHEQEGKKDDEKKSGIIWWGDFVKDLEDFAASSDYYYCECENIERSDVCYEYKVHASTKEKFFSIIYLFCELAVCKCQLRYWMESGLEYFFKEDNIYVNKKFM